jgi:hypothetical protein
MRRAIHLLLLFLLAAPACSREPEKKAPPPPVATDIRLPEVHVPAPQLPEPTGLQRANLPPVGTYLLPERVVEVKPVEMPRETPGVKRYELEASLEEVMEFYSKRGYRVVRNPKGASIFPHSGEGVLQVYRIEGRKVRLLYITRTTNEQDDGRSILNAEKLD